GTLSAPFTLVAGGSRASGTATRGDSYTLNVQQSTFPSSQASGLRGPQVGEQIIINLFNSQDPKSTELGIVTNSQTPLVCNATNTQTTFASSNICDFTTGGTINPTADGCLIGDGNISAQGSGNVSVVTVGQPQADQILQLSLTYNAPSVDFNLEIRAR